MLELDNQITHLLFNGISDHNLSTQREWPMANSCLVSQKNNINVEKHNMASVDNIAFTTIHISLTVFEIDL